MRELRHSIRQWTRTPVITFVVVLSLALGIGANTAVFSLVDGLLIRPLPVSRPHELVRVHETGYNFQSLPVFRYLQAHRSTLPPVAAVSLMRPDISSTAERRSALGLAVSGNFFELLGVGPAQGRLIADSDEREHADVAVLEYEFWQRAFSGRNVIGSTIPLDGRTFTIIGVVEQGFFGLNVGRRFDLAIPLDAFTRTWPGAADPLSNSLTIVARLERDQSLTAATGALQAVQPDLRASLRVPNTYPRLRTPLTFVPAGMGLATETQERYARPLRVLMGIVAVVLLVACANVANLLMARGAARRAEIATRLSLGATRLDVLRPLAVESLVIAMAGALGGIAVGALTARAIVAMIAVDQANVFATWIDVSPSRRMLAFTIAVGTLTSLIFGVGPALVSTRVSPIETMRQGGRGIAASRSRFGAAQLLVAAQVALSFVLVFAGALLVRSFVTMTQQNLGFDRGPLLVAVPDFSSGSVQRRERVPVSERIRDDIAALPGVRAASVSESTPFGFGLRPWPVTVPGKTPPDGELIPVSRISTGFISTLGMRILAGRDFAPAGLERPGVALVNETFQRRYLLPGQAVGQSVGIRMPGRTEFEVVGVVADARDMSMREPVTPTVYIPLLPSDEPWIEIGIRADADTSTLRRAVLDVVSRHAGQTGVEFRSLDAGLDASAARDRLVAWLAGGFALLALLLAALGLYGVMSYHVSGRRQEFGVRIAIGANPFRMTAMVIRESAVIVLAGIFGGVLAAAAAVQLIRSLLFGLSPADPVSISVAAAALSAICLVAGYLPARRAARIDPMTALRED